MTDVSTDVSSLLNAHYQTNVHKKETLLHTTNCVQFFIILTFSALRVGLRPTKKNLTYIFS